MMSSNGGTTAGGRTSFVPLTCEEDDEFVLTLVAEPDQEQPQQTLVKATSLKQLVIPGMLPLDSNSSHHIFQYDDNMNRSMHSSSRQKPPRSNSLTNLDKMMDSYDTPTNTSLAPTTAASTRRSRTNTTTSNSHTSTVGRSNSVRGLSSALKETFDKTMQLTKTSFLNNVPTTLKRSLSSNNALPVEVEEGSTQRDSPQKRDATITLEEQSHQAGDGEEDNGEFLGKEPTNLTTVRRVNGRLRRRTGGRGERKGRSSSTSLLSSNTGSNNAGDHKKQEGGSEKDTEKEGDILVPFDSHGNRRRSRSTPRLVSSHSRRQGSDRNPMANNITENTSANTSNTLIRRRANSGRKEAPEDNDNKPATNKSGIRRSKSSNSISHYNKRGLASSSCATAVNNDNAWVPTDDETTNEKAKTTTTADEKAARRSRRRKTTTRHTGQRASSQKAVTSKSLSDIKQQEGMDGSANSHGDQTTKTTTSRRKKSTTRPVKKSRSRSQSSLNTGLLGSATTATNNDHQDKRQMLDASEGDSGSESKSNTSRGNRRGRDTNSIVDSNNDLSREKQPTMKRSKSGSALAGIKSLSLSTRKRATTRRSKKTSSPPLSDDEHQDPKAKASDTTNMGKRATLDAFLAPTGSSRFDLDALLKDFSTSKDLAAPTVGGAGTGSEVKSGDDDNYQDHAMHKISLAHKMSLDFPIQDLLPDYKNMHGSTDTMDVVEIEECSVEQKEQQPITVVERERAGVPSNSNTDKASLDDKSKKVHEQDGVFSLEAHLLEDKEERREKAAANDKNNYDKKDDEDSTIASMGSPESMIDMDESLKSVQRVVQGAFSDATTERTDVPSKDRANRADTIAALSMLATNATQPVGIGHS